MASFTQTYLDESIDLIRKLDVSTRASRLWPMGSRRFARARGASSSSGSAEAPDTPGTP
jgi:hypothetical protein